MKKSARKKKDSFFQKPKEAFVEAINMSEKEKKRGIFSNRPLVVGATVVLILIVGLGAVYVFTYFQKDAVQSSVSTDKQVAEILEKLGKLVVLPTNETPTIATVTDVDKLSGQPFFRNAQNGDKVVIIGSTKEAILYRPSINKIITMAPINNTDLGATPSSPSAQTQGSAQVTPSQVTPTSAVVAKAKVAVFNSTKEVGLARKGADLLSDDAFEIVGTSNAQGEYEESTIVVINKNAASDAAVKTIIASYKDIKLVVKTLPSGEAAPAGADVVIILGSDFAEAY